jgi:hypothetical protein
MQAAKRTSMRPSGGGGPIQRWYVRFSMTCESAMTNPVVRTVASRGSSSTTRLSVVWPTGSVTRDASGRVYCTTSCRSPGTSGARTASESPRASIEAGENSPVPAATPVAPAGSGIVHVAASESRPTRVRGPSLRSSARSSTGRRLASVGCPMSQ